MSDEVAALPLDGNLATAHMSVAVADLGGLQSGEEHGTASPLPSLPPPPPPPRYKPEWLVRFLEKTSHEREEKKLEMKPQETGSLRAKYTALFQESKKGILNNKTIINNLRYATIWVYLEEEERLNYRVATGELSARHKLDNKERKTRSSEDHEATMSWLKRRRVELVNTPGRHETELIETEGQGSKETKKKLVPVWDLVDKVIECHEASGHYGREATFQHAKLIYAGIPSTACENVRSHCATCIKTDAEKGARNLEAACKQSMDVVSVWVRVQADLIDFRRTPSVDEITGQVYNWLLHVRDHGSRFSILVPLTRKKAKLVARELVKIFQTFGAPVVLHTDNGTEFRGQDCVSEMKRLWPAIKLVYGKPRRPRTQGLVERANGEVKKLLRKFLVERQLAPNKWSTLLTLVAFTMNNSFHRILGSTPFNLNFGRRPTNTLLDACFPSGSVVQEEELTKEQRDHMGLCDVTADKDDDADENDDNADDDGGDDDDVFAMLGEDEVSEEESEDEQVHVTRARAAGAEAAGAGAAADRAGAAADRAGAAGAATRTRRGAKRAGRAVAGRAEEASARKKAKA